MRLLLVDDHPLFIEGMRKLLVERGHQVLGLAFDGFAALEAVRAEQPDLVLMDIRMPRCDGLTATRLIKAEFPQVRIVILTMAADDAALFEALCAGASGYLLKSQDAASFYASLTDLARGEVVLAPELVTRVVKELARLTERTATGAPAAETPRLSARQAQVLSLLARGLTYKEIGGQLGVAESTVKYHMGEILDLLHLANRAEAEAYARGRGL